MIPLGSFILFGIFMFGMGIWTGGLIVPEIAARLGSETVIEVTVLNVGTAFAFPAMLWGMIWYGLISPFRRSRQ